ncbi:FtsX-like permease family protein [Streptomyces sp. LX-29]|uniref:FtsX-like permease family protein n=1 Tax=Streptomyces sp. LX-29 TaxID=2900152 RepID=UPI00240E539B|nr:FtsX-like permease family protein [Streptomyces sp. LX-29]WFB05616.1 FtsX-like permease family protein [Streptomyces sp. LX-29]
MRMLPIALKSLRARWVSLIGAFTALALGVAMMTVMLLGLATAMALPSDEAVVSLVAALGTAGGVSAFVSAFVVASTFSYAVAQRRRELGLLRLAGATRAQVRRTVLAEALVLGVVASAVGCVLGRLAAPGMVRWLADVGMAPPDLTLGQRSWPLHAAFWTGLLVALAGVAVAARRAGRLGPLDALRTADLDTGVMTAGRWFWGLGLLLTAAALTGNALVTDPADLLHRKTYTVQPMVLISACGLLAPVLARPLLRAFTWLPARWTSYAGRLVRENASTALRRTGAVAAPVLVSVALTGSLAGALDTVSAARTAEARSRTAADFVVVPHTASPDALAAALRAVPGVTVSPSAPTELSLVESDGTVVRSEARTADPATLATTARLPVLKGSVSALDDDGIVLPEEWGQTTIGAPVRVVRADGSRATLRVAAVLRDGLGDNGLYVTARNAPGARVDRIEIRLTATADATTPDLLRAAAHRFGVTVATREEWLAATAPAASRVAWLRTVLVLGLALTYTGIALANTLVMATADRRRELALLRLAGATRAQVIRLVTTESVLVVAVGSALGCAVAAVQLGTMHAGLALLGAGAPLVVPWRPLGLVTGACVLIAAPSAALAAAWALRRRPVAAAAR